MAVQAGWAVLDRGGSALDAVEKAVRVMEDDASFDAGRGSYTNTAGEIELDAMIMDGRDLNLGAVAAVQRIRHPVTLARLVMERSKHAFIVGPGAEEFARQHGMTACAFEELLADQRPPEAKAPPGEQTPDCAAQMSQTGTVGAVAMDWCGNLAAATSTGGMRDKLPGRVGDSPLVGSGAYADNGSGAASATGEGEALMKAVVSKTACDLIAQGHSPQKAAEAAIALVERRTKGHGGLILLDRQGRMGIAHSTPYMAHAFLGTGGAVAAAIERGKGY